MKSKVLKNVAVVVLAVLMALPVGMAVGSNEPVTDAGMGDSPGFAFGERAVASLGDSNYEVWVEGPQHDARLMFAMSSGSGGWTGPKQITGSEFNPMSVQMVAGSQTLHVVWQDGLTKLLRTGYMTINAGGKCSEPTVFQGEKPSLAICGETVAFSYIYFGTTNVQVSHDSGIGFTSYTIFDGLFSQNNRLSFSEGKLEAVASAGIRDQETGQLSSRGLYYTSFDDLSWSMPSMIAEAGPVNDLSFTEGTLTWTETSDFTKNSYEMTENGLGIFTDKVLVSSENIQKTPAGTQQPLPRLPPKKWTYIGYVDADNSLNSCGLEDLNEMEQIGSNADLNIIALFDGSSSGDSKAYYIQQDANMGAITSPQIPLNTINSSWGMELNMGAPQTSIDFVNYIYVNYPAEHYMWDMWDHGGSWLYGMCSDDTNGDDYTMLEVRTIYETLRIDNSKLKLFDVAGYDECLMSDVEVDYDEIPFIDYICNSEDSIPGDGWEYNMVLGPLAANPDMGGERAAWLIFDAYVDYYGTNSGPTMSIINSTVFFYELIPAINNLAQKGIHNITANRAVLQSAANNAKSWQGYTWNKDLIDFCNRAVAALPANEIKTAAQGVVTAGESNPPGTQYGGPSWQHDRAILIHNQNSGEEGITIYVASPPYNTLYNTLTFTENKWDEFYKVLWGSDASDPNIEPAVIITSPANGGYVTIDAYVVINGTASDADGSVQGVEVSMDTEHWEPATGTTSWSFGWDTTGWSFGPHWIQARSYDGQDYSAPYQIQVEMVDIPSEGTIELDSELYQQEATVAMEVVDRDLNTDPLTAQTVNINLKSVAEPAGETTILTETGPNTCMFQGAGTISGTNSAGVVWVNAMDTITATYNDADDGTGSPAVVTDTAAVDGLAPAAPSGLTVDHWGMISSNEVRFMRGIASEANVNGLTAYLAGTAQSTTVANAGNLGNNVNLYAGIRVWVRHSGGTETELTAGTAVAIVYGTATGTYSALWTPPFTILQPTDSVVVRFYVNTATPPTTVRATFTTEQLSATQLDADEWNMTYFLRKAGIAPGGSSLVWGTTAYDTRISGFSWKSSANYQDHNTLNWTHTGADVDHYVIYRSEMSSGPWDESHVIDTVPVGTNTYTDFNRGLGDTTIWWYVVRAEDGIGNRESNTISVPEPGAAPPYAINLAGKSANSWVFVSFPSDITGNIHTILDDAAAGDGLTTWTVAKWFNIQTPADPWKTYRVGVTTNDLATITNAMGLWLWITANGGDQALTLNAYAAPSTTPVTINLRTGWNMVGYPTMTSRSESATLPAQADFVATWQAATPYISQHAKGAALLSNGNAYWVHVTADCVWTVQP